MLFGWKIEVLQQSLFVVFHKFPFPPNRHHYALDAFVDHEVTVRRDNSDGFGAPLLAHPCNTRVRLVSIGGLSIQVVPELIQRQSKGDVGADDKDSYIFETVFCLALFWGCRVVLLDHVATFQDIDSFCGVLVASAPMPPRLSEVL